MEARDIFKNISPIDHRYSLSDPELFENLGAYISEDANIRYCIRVEAALLQAHLRLEGGFRKETADAVRSVGEKVTAEEVSLEEEKTRHNIRALVNVMKRYVPDEAKPFVHLGATSVDILDTAQALRIRDAARCVVIPLMADVLDGLIEVCEREADTPQVGRTHGQHAVPITFGFAMAEYVARFGKSLVEVERLSKNLRGKLAGAVGAYNATRLVTADPIEFERQVLENLAIEPSEHSTQLVEPEYLLRLLIEMNVAFGIIANLADDLRNLQRSEISEIREFFTSTQVGSSTMPQKRNPWNSEHVKSMWKAFFPRVMTMFMDQISEHQRDLSNSASSRFISDYIYGFCAALSRMRSILGSLYVDREAMKRNLYSSGDMVLAEAAYLLLAVGGDTDAHETVRKATLDCEANGTSLAEELEKDEVSWRILEDMCSRRMHCDAGTFFTKPELYRGMAKEKSLEISSRYRDILKNLREGMREYR